MLDRYRAKMNHHLLLGCHCWHIHDPFPNTFLSSVSVSDSVVVMFAIVGSQYDIPSHRHSVRPRICHSTPDPCTDMTHLCMMKNQSGQIVQHYNICVGSHHQSDSQEVHILFSVQRLLMSGPGHVSLYLVVLSDDSSEDVSVCRTQYACPH